MEDHCVICGEIIPEGTMVCKQCRNHILPEMHFEPIGRVWIYGYTKPAREKEQTESHEKHTV